MVALHRPAHLPDQSEVGRVAGEADRCN
ncbi:hypothetical protein BC938DRAFT_478192, partial [Jimgerdemannia flammicorona]